MPLRFYKLLCVLIMTSQRRGMSLYPREKEELVPLYAFENWDREKREREKPF